VLAPLNRPTTQKVNTRDRQAGAVTAAQQKNDITKRQATPQIRRSLKELSTTRTTSG
jgi:hypothetical protein